MTTDKRGISALLLQRQLGLSRYETAWVMLHKVRRAMVDATREPLRGEIEVDDTWVGGEQAARRGSPQVKNRRTALVLVAVEKRGKASADSPRKTSQPQDLGLLKPPDNQKEAKVREAQNASCRKAGHPRTTRRGRSEPALRQAPPTRQEYTCERATRRRPTLRRTRPQLRREASRNRQ